MKSTKIVKLVGSKCRVKLMIEDQNVEALWDTGVQVSIVSQAWKDRYLPGKEVQDVSKLLGEPDGLSLKAANGSDIHVPYLGWVEVEIGCAVRDGQMQYMTVPVLVSAEVTIEIPIIGYNVVEELVPACQVEATKTMKQYFPELTSRKYLSKSYNNQSLSTFAK